MSIKMNKNIVFKSLSLLSILFFTGCFNPVFYEIRKDVKPEPKTLHSPINSITRFQAGSTEFLTVLSDGGIRYKKADSTTHDEWKQYSSLPTKLHSYNFTESNHEGEQLIGLYASSNSLYLLSASYEIDESLGTTYPNKITLWGNSSITTKDDDNSTWKENEDWKLLIEDSFNKFFPIFRDGDYYYSSFCIFQTNSVQNANRKVFIRSGDPNSLRTEFRNTSYFELQGLSVKEINLDNITIVDSKEKNCIRSAVVFDSKVLFFNAYASTTNETKDSPATVFYYSVGQDLCYGKDTANTTKALSISKTNISALAVCNDAILIGCAKYDSTEGSSSNGGIFKTYLSKEGIPGSSTISFETNAQFQITTSYYITALINATPEKSEKESCLYCASQVFGTGTSSSGSTKNVGLWSYYPTRGNWNRE